MDFKPQETDCNYCWPGTAKSMQCAIWVQYCHVYIDLAIMHSRLSVWLSAFPISVRGSVRALSDLLEMHNTTVLSCQLTPRLVADTFIDALVILPGLH